MTKVHVFVILFHFDALCMCNVHSFALCVLFQMHLSREELEQQTIERKIKESLVDF